MKFTVKCATFCRLAGILNYFDPSVDPEIKQHLSCVRLENKNGKAFIISSNQKIAAVEYIGDTTESDGYADVCIDPILVKQCESETVFNSSLEITTVPQLKMGSAKTMCGFVYSGNACIYNENSILDKWRTWIPKAPLKKSEGALYLNLNYVQSLLLSSPSGKVIFPSHIDTNQPIVLRDRESENWVGLLMGKPHPSESQAIPATLPKWWN